MRLDDLLGASGLAGRGLGAETFADPGVEISSVTMDSRRVTPGALFACVVGRHRDGHDFAGAAVTAGASALIVERRLDIAAPQVVVADTRAVLGPICDAFFDHPSATLRTVGVTGTNGKTTTVSLLAAIFGAHGWRAEALGTLSGVRTTPEAPDLQARLAGLRDSGHDAVAMEVSSHALDQGRVDGTCFDVGVWTNLTPDHLDYHRSMEGYFAAKARLFEPGRCAAAVVNRDDPYGRRLIEAIEGRLAVATFGLADAEGLRVTAEGSRFVWDGVEIDLHLRGGFNVSNALAAATAARQLGIPAPDVAEGLASVERIRGRFEVVDAGQPFVVVVDYAHTPDGLAQALGAAREITTGRLLVVFGAGGDRDPSKRPMMGEVATRLADLVVVTSDNPRSEDPMAIIEQVVSHVPAERRPVEQPDRREAIGAALAAAAPGDVVLIAGKGHESGQDQGGKVEPFDDVAEARRALERILSSRRDRRGHGA